MPTFIKTGFWEKVAKGYKGWLNLDDLIASIASGNANDTSLTFLQEEIQYVNNTTIYEVNGTASIYSRELRFPNLVTVAHDFHLQNGSSVNFYGELFSAPNLTTVGGCFQLRGGNNAANAHVNTIDLSSLTSVGANPWPDDGRIIGDGLGLTALAITTLNLSNLTFANAIYIQDNPNVTSIDLSSLTGTGTSVFGGNAGMALINNASLTTINLSGLTTVSLNANYNFSSNALNVTTVNAILVKFATISPTGTGTIDLSGGTNAAPTGAGLTAKTTLESGGWTVTTN